MTDPIKTLARKCVGAGLNLADSRRLFDSLYIADAIMIEGGNRTRAAERAGIERASLLRMRRREMQEIEDFEFPGRPDGGWVE